MNLKKAQVMGQVFIYIIAAVTFAVILIFGYGAIKDFLERGETVEFYTFKSSLETSVQELYSQRGSARIEGFTLSSKYKEICFVDVEQDPPEEEAPFCLDHGIVCNVWRTAYESDGSEAFSNTESNVFLKPLPPVPLKVYRIEPDGGGKFPTGTLCLNITNGHFKVKFEGMGDRTKISPISS